MGWAYVSFQRGHSGREASAACRCYRMLQLMGGSRVKRRQVVWEVLVCGGRYSEGVQNTGIWVGSYCRVCESVSVIWAIFFRLGCDSYRKFFLLNNSVVWGTVSIVTFNSKIFVTFKTNPQTLCILMPLHYFPFPLYICLHWVFHVPGITGLLCLI